MYMSSGDEQASRHTQHIHDVPMTFKSFLAPVAALSLAVSGAFLVPGEARADYFNSTGFGNGSYSHSGSINGNSYYGNTTSFGSGNSSTTMYGPNGSSSTCSTTSFGSSSSTYCY